MEKIFEGKTCTAEYNPEKERMEFIFHGYPNIDEHKSMYLIAVEYLKTHKTQALLSNFRDLKGTFSMLNEWVIEQFRPAVEKGLKKSALVLNDDIFTQFAANDALKKIKLIEVQVFKDIEEARQWTEL